MGSKAARPSRLCLALSLLLLCGSSAAVVPGAAAAEKPVAPKQAKKAETSSPIAPVKTWTSLQSAHVVLQKYDFSCGASALATLLNFYFGEDFSELDMLRLAQLRYDPQAWKARVAAGLSLDDLAFMAARAGYAAEGAQIGLAGLLETKGPIIVHLNKGEFQHFSVFRGVKDGMILLADSVTGETRFSPGEFARQYTGYALAVWREGFKLPTKYPLGVTDADVRHELDHAKEISRGRYQGMFSTLF